MSFSCPFCVKEFDKKHHLKYHMFKRKSHCLEELIADGAINFQLNDHQRYFVDKLVCVFCGKKYSSYSNLTKHQKRSCSKKKYLTKIVKDNEQKLHGFRNDLKCNYCNYTFTRKDNLLRHIYLRCKIKKKVFEEREVIYQQLVEQMMVQNKNLIKQTKQLEMVIQENKQLRQQNESLINKITDNRTGCNYQCNNVINSNNTINNIQIVAFGKEDMDNINEKVSIYCMKRGCMAVPALIKYMHFNQNKPQYHNVYISNMRDPYAMIFDGCNWTLTNKFEIIDDLYEKNKGHLTSKFEDFYDALPEYTKIMFQKFLDQEDDDACVNAIKREIKLLLYNRRHMVVKTKKMIKK